MSKVHVFKRHMGKSVKLSFDMEDYLKFSNTIRITEMRKGQEIVLAGSFKGILARLVMRCPRGLQTDHVDRNTFNNCKDNLRIVTPMENKWNTGAHKDSMYSKHKGVSFDKYYRGTQKWQTKITAAGVTKKARFKTEIDAAKQYNEWAKALHGEFAVLNEVDND